MSRHAVDLEMLVIMDSGQFQSLKTKMPVMRLETLMTGGVQSSTLLWCFDLIVFRAQ